MTKPKQIESLPPIENIDLKREWIIRFTANKRHVKGRYFRTLCNPDNLHNHVGEQNAITALTEALKSVDDKFTIKFRTHGRIEFWRK